MKKIYLAIILIIFFASAYLSYRYSTEGTLFDNPRIFYIEDSNAIYSVTVDDSAGYYFLEGINSFPDRKEFRIIIGKSPSPLDEFVGKNVKIEGDVRNTYLSKIPCRNGWENWCSSQNKNDFLITVWINRITTISN